MATVSRTRILSAVTVSASVGSRWRSRVQNDAFPTTMATWIDDRIASETGRAEIKHHIMDVYRDPLMIYYRGTRDRWLGSAEEIVGGFFADRLSRPAFLERWGSSGIPLRRWLMNALCFYLKEVRKARKRDARMTSMEAANIPEASSPDVAAREVDQAFVRSVVRVCLVRAEVECQSEDLELHWSAFSLHYLDGLSHEEIALRLGVTQERVAVLSRVARHRFRRHVRAAVARDAGVKSEVDARLDELLEAIEQ